MLIYCISSCVSSLILYAASLYISICSCSIPPTVYVLSPLPVWLASFRSASSNTAVSLSLSAAQSLIFWLLLGDSEMNRGRENWSPSVTTCVAGLLKAAGRRVAKGSDWPLNVYLPSNLLFGSVSLHSVFKTFALVPQFNKYHHTQTGRWGHRMDMHKRNSYLCLHKNTQMYQIMVTLEDIR